MQYREFRGQSEEKIVRQICQGQLRKEERKRGVMALVARHHDDVVRGLQRKNRPSDPEWRRASENLGYDGVPTLQVVEYLLHEPQRGEYAGTPRICTYLDSPKSFGGWISTRLFGLARKLQNQIKKEKESLQKSTEPSTSEGPTLSGSSSSFSPAEAIAEDYEMDRTLDYIDERMKSVIDRATMLLEQLEGNCRGVLDGFFLSDAPEVLQVISRVEDCLLQFADVMQREDTEPEDFGIRRGRSELWECARQLSELCQSLVLGRYFLGLDYWKLGRAYSDNEKDDYESPDKYRDSEHSWARYRIKEAKCREEVEDKCTDSAADYMDEV
jgi:hypothetical protein